MTVSKSLVAAGALVIGLGLGRAGEFFEADHFATWAKLAGPPVSEIYQRCLDAHAYGHDLDPLTLREFCGAWVFNRYVQPPPAGTPTPSTS